MRIATWNINSVRLRLPTVLRFLQEQAPDVLCLQETKTEDQHFPAEALAEAGYAHQAIRGQKSYNGVAVVSRVPFAESDSRDWCGKSDCRHQAVRLEGGIEVHNFYVPAGGDEPDPAVNDKFAHKLAFLDEMVEWFGSARKSSEPMVLVGDLNIAPLETDVWSHKQLLKVVSHTPVEVEALAKVQDGLGWVDAVRHFVPETEKLYSWWSYRSRDWEKADKGRRLDHVWVTEPLKPRLKGASIAKALRGGEKPSDHAPVIVDLD
ncbi:exodeoxyribonuclease III [Nisaea acidiphila]|uniref:Exodeoxyribonuclease III n=1 Tax=Nisaea acidiphila TaxID=1862145 RepID=A0A9J7AM14_9PROT|nr:exodeoxyribonuclease III [Nisaea acidiphila]UUX48002.1 exodeoxyribonuclease III [Nisaea acidiphila]